MSGWAGLNTQNMDHFAALQLRKQSRVQQQKHKHENSTNLHYTPNSAVLYTIQLGNGLALIYRYIPHKLGFTNTNHLTWNRIVARKLQLTVLVTQL